MNQVIKVPKKIYDRLGAHAKGFETPAGVIERLLDYYEQQEGIELQVDPSPSIVEPSELEIVYYPDGEQTFKDEFLKTKRAYVLLHKTDGTTELKVWRAMNFQPHSSVNGNLRSGYLRGWRNKGILKAEISVNKDDFE